MMPEETAESQPVVHFNPGLLKSVFDWSWKAILILWAAFQFYSNQDRLLQSSAESKAKITGLETQINQMTRELSDERSDIKALKQQLDDDREFYLRTNHKSP